MPKYKGLRLIQKPKDNHYPTHDDAMLGALGYLWRGLHNDCVILYKKGKARWNPLWSIELKRREE